MGDSSLDQLTSPAIREELQFRLDMWREILGGGIPEEMRRRARAAGYYAPKAQGGKVDISDSYEFYAFTSLKKDPYYEFSIAISLGFRPLTIALVASEDLLIGWRTEIFSVAKSPFSRPSDWIQAKNLICKFSESSYIKLLAELSKLGIVEQADRKYLALDLAHNIDCFIVFHEYGHQRWGHTQFVNQYGASRILRQAFELEADENAILAMFNALYVSNPFSDPSQRTQELRTLQTMNSSSRWRIWTTMLGVLFLALELSDPGTCLPGERRFLPWKGRIAYHHPPPLYRLYNSVRVGRNIVASQGIDAVAIYNESVKSALGDVNKIAKMLKIADPLRYFRLDTSSYEQELTYERQLVDSKLKEIQSKIAIFENSD